MDQKLMDAITEKTKELRDAVTCSAEAKAAAQAWLDAVGTQQIESMAYEADLKELEEDIVAIDDLIALAESEQGKQIFGEEKASQVAEHARKIKQEGAVYCDCPSAQQPACILEKKEELLEAVKS
ncbi:MAG: molecular chaperone Hsp90 [[Clostridium] innocuum]